MEVIVKLWQPRPADPLWQMQTQTRQGSVVIKLLAGVKDLLIHERNSAERITSLLWSVITPVNQRNVDISGEWHSYGRRKVVWHSQIND